MTDWNADRYHEISAPQHARGRRVLDRLTLLTLDYWRLNIDARRPAA